MFVSVAAPGPTRVVAGEVTSQDMTPQGSESAPLSPVAIVEIAPGGAPAPPAALPLHKRRWFRVLVTRIVMRLSMIGVIVGLGFAFSWGSVVDAYSHWIHGFHPRAASVALFTVLASVFAGIAPGARIAPSLLAAASSFQGVGICDVLVCEFVGACAWVCLCHMCF